MADFRSMLAWKKADDLVVRVYQLTGDFPPEERYGLTSQFRRAAMSVAANIAEGSGRQTLKDFRQFLFAAQGSLNEVQYYIHLSCRLNFLTEESARQLEQDRQEVGMTLQGLIKWATREIENGRTAL